MRKELFQRIANVVKSLNMALDAAAGEGIGVTIYTLPSFATDQDNPIVGCGFLRLLKALRSRKTLCGSGCRCHTRRTERRGETGRKPPCRPSLEWCSDLDSVRHSTRCGSGAFGAAPSPNATTDVATARNSRSGMRRHRFGGTAAHQATTIRPGNRAEGYK